MIEQQSCSKRGEVVAIGSLKLLPSQSLPCRIPILSFLVFKKGPQDFTAICFQILIDGKGSTLEEAAENLKERCWKYFQVVFSNRDPWEKLSRSFKTNKEKNELRDLYYYNQLKVAEDGANAEFADELAERIERLKNKLDNLNEEKKIAGLPPEKVPKYTDIEIVGVRRFL